MRPPGQFHCHGGRERDALVGRAEHHVELDTTGQQGFCIEFRKAAKFVAVVEKPRIEEIRAQTPCLGLEFAKTQDAGLHGKLHETLRQIVS